MTVNTFLFRKCSRDELDSVWDKNETGLKNDTKDINLERNGEMKKTEENVKASL